jgi:hypothetical protein
MDMSEAVKSIEDLLIIGVDDDSVRKAYTNTFKAELPEGEVVDIIAKDTETSRRLVEMLKGFKMLCTAAMDDVLKTAEPSELPPKELTKFRRMKTLRGKINKYINAAPSKTAEEVEYTDLDDEESKAINEEAMNVLKAGKPIEYIMDVWHKDYVGSDHYGRSLIFSMYCGTVNNTWGLNPAADGDSGTGKSFAMKAMANLNCPEYMVIGVVTPRALFHNGVKAGTTVFMDDVGKMKEDIEQLYKVSTSQYQQGYTLLSVDNNAKGEKGMRLPFPKCINWWLTGVDVNSFDKQILNRNVQVGLDEPNKKLKAEQQADVLKHQYASGVSGRPALEITKDVLICREISRILLSASQVNVRIPWLEDEQGPIMVWKSSDNPRNFQIFTDMIRVSASIHRFQRSQKDGSIIATLEDYDNAFKCWEKVCGETISKVGKKDRAFIQKLKEMGCSTRNPLDLYQIEEATDIPYKTLYYRIKGDESKGIKGLPDRYPNLRVVEQQETEYDKELSEDVYGEHERKKGSKTTRRILLMLVGTYNELEMSSSVVEIDRERATKRLSEFTQ